MRNAGTEPVGIEIGRLPPMACAASKSVPASLTQNTAGLNVKPRLAYSVAGIARLAPLARFTGFPAPLTSKVTSVCGIEVKNDASEITSARALPAIGTRVANAAHAAAGNPL